MTKKNQDDATFSELFKDAKLLKHDKFERSRADKVKAKRARQIENTHERLSDARAQQNASIALSDGFEAHWPENKPIKFIRESLTLDIHVNKLADKTQSKSDEHFIRKDLLKQLQLGNIPPDIELDVHGLTGKQAKDEIISVIFEANKRHFPCINIIHGHGNGVLKHKIPNWLVQHPDVAGFIQAPKAYGGKAGLLVLVGRDFNAIK